MGRNVVKISLTISLSRAGKKIQKIKFPLKMQLCVALCMHSRLRATSILCEKHLQNVPTPVNPFPNDKISDVTKLKPFANDKLKIAEMVISLFDRIENTVGIGENISFWN